MQKEKFIDFGPSGVDYAAIATEFKKIRNEYLGSTADSAQRPSYLTFHVTHSSLDPSNISPDVPIYSQELKSIRAEATADPSKFKDYVSTWSTDNIRDVWQGTYTGQFIRDLDKNWVYHRGERITFVKFFYLKSNQCLTMHTDMINRQYSMIHHIPIDTNNGCFIYIDGDCYKMSQLGNIYKIRQDLPHTPVNAGQTERIHLSFSTIPL